MPTGLLDPIWSKIWETYMDKIIGNQGIVPSNMHSMQEAYASAKHVIIDFPTASAPSTPTLNTLHATYDAGALNTAGVAGLSQLHRVLRTRVPLWVLLFTSEHS